MSDQPTSSMDVMDDDQKLERCSKVFQSLCHSHQKLLENGIPSEWWESPGKISD